MEDLPPVAEGPVATAAATVALAAAAGTAAASGVPAGVVADASTAMSAGGPPVTAVGGAGTALGSYVGSQLLQSQDSAVGSGGHTLTGSAAESFASGNLVPSADDDDAMSSTGGSAPISLMPAVAAVTDHSSASAALMLVQLGVPPLFSFPPRVASRHTSGASDDVHATALSTLRTGLDDDANDGDHCDDASRGFTVGVLQPSHASGLAGSGHSHGSAAATAPFTDDHCATDAPAPPSSHPPTHTTGSTLLLFGCAVVTEPAQSISSFLSGSN